MRRIGAALVLVLVATSVGCGVLVASSDDPTPEPLSEAGRDPIDGAVGDTGDASPGEDAGENSASRIRNITFENNELIGGPTGADSVTGTTKLYPGGIHGLASAAVNDGYIVGSFDGPRQEIFVTICVKHLAQPATGEPIPFLRIPLGPGPHVDLELAPGDAVYVTAGIDLSGALAPLPEGLGAGTHCFGLHVVRTDVDVTVAAWGAPFGTPFTGAGLVIKSTGQTSAMTEVRVGAVGTSNFNAIVDDLRIDTAAMPAPP